MLSPSVLVVYTPPASNHSYIPSHLYYLSHLISVLGHVGRLISSSLSSHLFCDFIFDHNLLQLIAVLTHRNADMLGLVDY